MPIDLSPRDLSPRDLVRRSMLAAVAAPLLALALGAPATLAADTTPSETPTSIAAWGDDSRGELGDGNFTQADTPAGVGGVSGVRAVAAGDGFDLALLSNGTVLAWGENQYGQLGNGSAGTQVATPAPVKGLSDVTAVSAGGGHALALLADGRVMAWGYNAFGQLGDGTTSDSSTPVEVEKLRAVKAIAAGATHSLALLSSGKLMAWGNDELGQLGNGKLEEDSSVPSPVKGLKGVTAISAGYAGSLALLKNGNATRIGDDFTKPEGIASKATAISQGIDLGLVLLASGKVLAFGENDFDQLGPGAPSPEEGGPVEVPGLGHVTAVAAGGGYGLALTSAGTVEAWGDGAQGELGNGSAEITSKVVTVSGLADVTAIAAGQSAALALRTLAAPAPPTAVEDPWQTFPTVAPEALPATGVTSDSFAAASASGADDAWGVGENQTGNFEHDGEHSESPLAEHWNGNEWSLASVPTPAEQS